MLRNMQCARPRASGWKWYLDAASTQLGMLSIWLCSTKLCAATRDLFDSADKLRNLLVAVLRTFGTACASVTADMS